MRFSSGKQCKSKKNGPPEVFLNEHCQSFWGGLVPVYTGERFTYRYTLPGGGSGSGKKNSGSETPR